MNRILENLKKITRWRIVGIYFIIDGFFGVIKIFTKLYQLGINEIIGEFQNSIFPLLGILFLIISPFKFIIGIFLYKENKIAKIIFGLFLLFMIIFALIAISGNPFREIYDYVLIMPYILLFYFLYLFRRNKENKDKAIIQN